MEDLGVKAVALAGGTTAEDIPAVPVSVGVTLGDTTLTMGCRLEKGMGVSVINDDTYAIKPMSDMAGRVDSAEALDTG